MVNYTIREVQVNYKRKKADSPVQITGETSVADFVRSRLPNNSQEHFIALYLDGAHNVIGWSVVTTGIANRCEVHPREIFQRAILLGAVSIVVSHNHPSGSDLPSDADKSLTTRLVQAGDLLGIRVLDHVIVTDYGSRSILH